MRCYLAGHSGSVRYLLHDSLQLPGTQVEAVIHREVAFEECSNPIGHVDHVGPTLVLLVERSVKVEVMGLMGFIFGMTGISFAIIAWGLGRV